MTSLKRISKIALWIYIFAVPLSFLTQSDVMLGACFTEVNPEGSMDVGGDMIYTRGGDVSFFGYSNALLTGLSEFKITTNESFSYSADSIVEGIESGEIQSSQISWKLNWDAFVMAYVVLWIFVAFFIGIGFFRESRSAKSEADLESSP